MDGLTWKISDKRGPTNIACISEPLKKYTETHTKIGVLEESNKVGFTSLLQRHDCWTLEPQVGLEVLGDLANKTLERELANQQLCGLLVPKNVRHQNIGNEEVHSITF